MSIEILGKILLNFFIYILLQILIFNNAGITSLEIVPMFFLLSVLMIPVETPKWITLIAAFMLGIIIDIFSDTPGLNAFSTVLVAFFRPFILQYFSPRGGYEVAALPRIATLGISWFIKYTSVLIFIHQFSYYFMDNFGFNDFFYILTKIVIGTLYTFILILISQFIFFRK